MFARLGMIAAAFLISSTAPGARAAEKLVWEGAYIGIDAGISKISNKFRSDYVNWNAETQEAGTASVGLHAGYGLTRGAFYLGLEAGLEAIDGSANGDFTIIGSLPPVFSGGGSGSGQSSAGGAAAAGGIVGGIATGVAQGCLVGGNCAAPSFVRVLHTNRVEAYDTQINGLGSLSGRLGVPVGRAMPYLLAGIAVGSVTTQYIHYNSDVVQDSFARRYRKNVAGAFEGDRFAVGYNIGIGSAFAVTDRVSLRGEYLYTDLGRTEITRSDDSGKAIISNDLHRVRLGLSLRF